MTGECLARLRFVLHDLKVSKRLQEDWARVSPIVSRYILEIEGIHHLKAKMLQCTAHVHRPQNDI